jgi:hypothetical protein
MNVESNKLASPNPGVMARSSVTLSSNDLRSLASTSALIPSRASNLQK